MVETRTQGEERHIPEQLTRYQLDNHLQSVTLELDEEARILTYEEYTPYGSTSYQAAGQRTETPKRYGYASKERDGENGLYYYGARYYSPAVSRWINCDPIGIGDGLDLYVYCHCNLSTLSDPDGRYAFYLKKHAGDPVPTPAPTSGSAALGVGDSGLGKINKDNVEYLNLREGNWSYMERDGTVKRFTPNDSPMSWDENNRPDYLTRELEQYGGENNKARRAKNKSTPEKTPWKSSEIYTGYTMVSRNRKGQWTGYEWSHGLPDVFKAVWKLVGVDETRPEHGHELPGALHKAITAADWDTDWTWFVKTMDWTDMVETGRLELAKNMIIDFHKRIRIKYGNDHPGYNAESYYNTERGKGTPDREKVAQKAEEIIMKAKAGIEALERGMLSYGSMDSVSNYGSTKEEKKGDK
jgi:RHS repeat-associated protein